MAVAVVERWPLAGGLNKRKSFCWNEIKVTVVEKWPLVEV